LDTVGSARVARHAFARRCRDAPLTDAAQSRRYTHADDGAEKSETFAETAALSLRRGLREGRNRSEERSHQAEAQANQIAFHRFSFEKG
jgi:hypothetical protein